MADRTARCCCPLRWRRPNPRNRRRRSAMHEQRWWELPKTAGASPRVPTTAVTDRGGERDTCVQLMSARTSSSAAALAAAASKASAGITSASRSRSVFALPSLPVDSCGPSYPQDQMTAPVTVPPGASVSCTKVATTGWSHMTEWQVEQRDCEPPSDVHRSAVMSSVHQSSLAIAAPRGVLWIRTRTCPLGKRPPRRAHPSS